MIIEEFALTVRSGMHKLILVSKADPLNDSFEESINNDS